MGYYGFCRYGVRFTVTPITAPSALWMIVGGATIASAAATKLSFIPYSAAVATLLIVAAGGYTVEAGWMEQADNGLGVHLNSTWTSVPLGIYANTP